jgi:Undecaprenyl-phosphate glucose phosphotransferase
MLHDVTASFAPPRPMRAKFPEASKFENLSHFIFRSAAIEFVVVAGVAGATSVAYDFAVGRAPSAAGRYAAPAVAIATLVLAVSLALRHYATLQTQPLHRFLWNGAAASGVAVSLLLAGLFLLKVSDDYSRATFLTQSAVVTVSVLAMRAALHTRVRSALAAGRIEARRAVLLGEAAPPTAIRRRLAAAGVRIVKALPLPKDAFDDDRAAETWRTEADDIVATCRAARPDDIVILAPSASLPATQRLAELLSELPATLHAIPADLSDRLGEARIGELGEVVTIQLARAPLSALDQFLKRAFDLLAAGTGLILLSPALALVALAIKLDSPGPVFYLQTRHGYNNDPIRVFKFRSMHAGRDCAFRQATRGDPRVTRVGRFLRRTNIDELPQLINVLLGQMSIVGPRPHPIDLNQTFAKRISPFSRRHNVKPGITGWAQVRGHRGETDTLEKMQRRFEHDVYYIDNWSFIFDLKIIVLTLFSKTAYTNAF